MDNTATLVALIEILRAHDYAFVAPTPATHRIVIGRRRVAHDLRDVMGWSLPFHPELLPADVLAALKAAKALGRRGDLMRSKLRCSSLGGMLFLHSAYPTEAEDSVFFGPDSYRFSRFIEARARSETESLVDIGGGSGVGAAVAAKVTGARRIVVTEVNDKAIALARANLQAAGIEAEIVKTEGLDGVKEEFDLVIANPPFIADPKGRAYRDGGDMHGAELSLDWARQAMARLAPGGRLLLYTGVAIVGGREPLCEALRKEVASPFDMTCEEIDPDIFGEELRKPAYRGVERIAAVGITVSRDGAGRSRSR
jgi:hypothetical protein